MNLTKFAVRNRTTVLVFAGILLAYGLVSYLTMSRRENPEIKVRTCIVRVGWPGATARKVEALITDPLESAIGQIDEVEEIRSESRTGLSLIFVDMDERIPNVSQLWDEVRSKVDAVTPRLPSGSQPPVVDTDFGDVYDVVLAMRQVSAPGREKIERTYSPRELELMAEAIVDDLEGLSSVSRVDIMGAQQEVIDIAIEPGQWAKVDLTIDTLRGLLESRNITAPGGEIVEGDTAYTVTPSGEFTSVDEIGSTVVHVVEKSPVSLNQLPVTINRTYADPPSNRFRYTEPETAPSPCLLICVSMKKGENVVSMGADVDQRLSLLQQRQLPPDIELTHVNNLPRQVDDLVASFTENLVQAIIIVIVVALLMMGWRSAIIMATAIPLSMLVTIAIVRHLNVELEQFSVASLIIAMGMVVDNAIVVSDNTITELARKGQSRDTSIIRGAWDLATPILTSTLTTVAAFAGMLTMVGSSGEFVRSLPIVVATTLLISYVVAMMITPILCAWLLKAPDENTKPQRSILTTITGLFRKRSKTIIAKPKQKSKFISGYEAIIHWCLSHRIITLSIATIAVIGSLGLVPLIGNEFFPQGNRDQFFIHIWLPEGSSLDATSRACEQVEDILVTTSETQHNGSTTHRLKSATTCVGTGGPRLTLTLNPEQSNRSYAHILVNTTDPALTNAWSDEVRQAVAAIPGALIDVRRYELGPYVKRPVEFAIIGDDEAVLRDVGESALRILRTTKGAGNPTTDWRNSVVHMSLDVDERAANLAGVTNLSIADTLNALLSGGVLTTYREDDHQIRTLLRVEQQSRAKLLQGLEDIHVNGNSGKVPLGSIAQISAEWEPAIIARLDQRRCVRIGCLALPGHLPNDVTSAAQPKIQALVSKLPEGYRVEQSGAAKETAKAGAKLSVAFTISLVLIILTLVCQYNSLVMPLLVLLSIPLSLVGALLGLYLSGWALGFMPSLGIVALAGIVINNAIILIDVIETKITNGTSIPEAIASAGAARMRPIALSVLTTVGGLLPLALFGGPMWAGMAWAMILGLLISTAMTLFVTPSLYSVLAQRRAQSLAPQPKTLPA